MAAGTQPAWVQDRQGTSSKREKETLAPTLDQEAFSDGYLLAKEKLNLFMKGQDTDLDLIYDKFGIDYNLLALLLHRGVDEEGNFQIQWGDQQIA